MKYNLNKIHFLLIVFLVVIVITQLTLCTAEQSTLGTFKLNDCVELRQICSNCSYNNISSVLYPNSTLASGEVAMIKTGTNFAYTFCNTSMLGKYIVNGFGDVEGYVTVWAYDFNITTTGNNAPYTIPLFLGLAAFILLIFAFLLHNNYLGFITGILFIVLGIYLFVYGLGIMSDFYTNAFAIVALGLGLLIFLASSYSAINETNINLFGKGGGDDDDF